MTQPTVPPAPPCTLVIFGARGDLTKRLLIPSIYNLAHAGLLDDKFRILGVDHGDCDDQGLRDSLSDFIKGLAKGGGEFGSTTLDPNAWAFVEQRIFYLKGDFEDASTYQALGAQLARL